MKSLTNHSLKFILLSLLFVLGAMSTVKAQDARLRLDRLNRLEERAVDVVEVNIEGKLLDMAKRVLNKSNDPNARKVGQAIVGLRGIYVRVFNFANENEYNVADVDEIRAQLQAPGWERLVNVRSKRNNQKIDVFTMFQGDAMSGVAVVVSESKSIALINVIGPIDIDALAEMSGKMNIPKIDIEREENPEQPKN
ncbi:MAG: DUF4252 domain-containing protein [Acidobacteriota bacterium]|nr:DUF4252 domain-containing protein [Acidobacteriota bacterium]